MKFLNFELSKPSFSIELNGLGYVWDLHNAGQFVGLKIIPTDNTVVMSWRITGHPATQFSGCNLVFIGLKLLIVSSRDEELPSSEDLCLSAISKISPGSDEPDRRIKADWGKSDPFHLLFEFQSGRSIEVNAETVELVSVD